MSGMSIVTSQNFVSLTVTPFKAGMRTAVLPALIASFMLAACGKIQHPPSMAELSALPVSSPAGAPANSARATAAKFPDVDLNACLGSARGGSALSEQNCPGYISASLPDMISTCEQVGGTLVANAQPALQSLDVNGDAKPEILIDLAENYLCDGAASVFSCGSLGCATTLFERRNGSWSAIGFLNALDAPAAEVLASQPGSTYGTLRGGCSGERPCDELTYYQWDGNSYQPTLIEVRGHWVDRKNEGFWTLTRDMPLLESPAADAAILDHYPKGTEVIVIGRSRDTPYLYVSPCNACSNGFIDRAHLVDATSTP
jgi:hypothetical protein